MERQNSNCSLDDNTDLHERKPSRFVVPGDFIFKIQSFSSLLDWTTKKVESGMFKSGGFKWRLRLSLSGSNEQLGGDHISLYLSLADATKLPSGWEILINCKLFLFNHFTNDYLTFQDDKKEWRFHCLKTEWLFDQVLDISTFADPTNGFVVDNWCAVGIEICVVKRPNNATFELLDLSKIERSIFTWKIKNFSDFKTAVVLGSDEFIIGGRKWRLHLHPNEYDHQVGKCLSLYLALVDYKSLGESQLKVKFALRIIDQYYGVHKEHTICEKLFSSMKPHNDFGFPNMLSLKDLNDGQNKYLLDNTLVVEAEILELTMIKALKISNVPAVR